jgi:predicted RNase H-like HicB family nuclease
MPSRKKTNSDALLRAVHRLEPYPAVFCPIPPRGWDVIFPNFPRLKAFGVDRQRAEQAAIEALTAELQLMLVEDDQPPTPSDPERLIPDEDEAPGTQTVLLKPDKKVILRRLGLEARERGQAMAATLGRLGKG